MHDAALSCFSDRLALAMERVGPPVCVGLDPVIERLPDDGVSSGEPALRIADFCRRVIDAVTPFVAAVKPQSACFERYGAPGVDALARTIAHARDAGLPVVLDAKRGDIGVSASHYAAGARALGADAITLSPYMGPSTIEPFLEADLGVFVLVRTSNPDSDRVQSLPLSDGGTLAESVASMVRDLGIGHTGSRGLSDVGAVVGLTKSADARRLRELMPNQVFLVPGYGVQGGSADDLARLVTRDFRVPGRGVLVTASRSVIYAEREAGETWTDAVARAAESFGHAVADAIHDV